MTDDQARSGRGTPPAAPAPPAGGAAPTLRRGALTGYLWSLIAFLALGVLQIFFAGLGVFSLDGQEIGSPTETAFAPHRVTGNAMTLVAVLILVLALAARAGRPAIVMSVVLLALISVVQTLLADLGKDAAVLGGLHALVGIGLLGLAGRMLSQARAALRAAG